MNSLMYIRKGPEGSVPYFPKSKKGYKQTTVLRLGPFVQPFTLRGLRGRLVILLNVCNKPEGMCALSGDADQCRLFLRFHVISLGARISPF